MIKAIIFDLDNTLTDFMKMKEAGIDGAIDGMIDAGLQISRAEAKEKIFAIYDRKGIEYQQVFDMFLHEELGDIDFKKLAAAVVGYRRARDSHLVLYPHVHLALMELAKRGLKLAVVTDAPRLQAWLRLCYLNLHHVFDHVITFEDTEQRKPSPAPFRQALRLLSVKAEESIMVGDWVERDMVGAARVGIVTVFARYGDTFDTVSPQADYEINDIMELVDVVDKLNSRKRTPKAKKP